MVLKVKHPGDAENPVGPGGLGNNGRQSGGIQNSLLVEIIDEDHGAAGDQFRRDHLPDVILGFRQRAPFRARTGCDDADQAGQQTLPGSLSGRLDEVYGSKPTNDALQKREEHCRNGMSAIRIPNKRKIDQ